MPRHVVTRIQDALNDSGKPLKNSRILVLGTAYKPDVDDLRESPALDVIGLLIQKGALVQYHDPYIKTIQHDGWELATVSDLVDAVKNVDCVVIITNHSLYDYKKIAQESRIIVDTRNALGKIKGIKQKVYKL
jgi:UDP-N-acetyl-D-glucosamine dehydrogenase